MIDFMTTDFAKLMNSLGYDQDGPVCQICKNPVACHLNPCSEIPIGTTLPILEHQREQYQRLIEKEKK